MDIKIPRILLSGLSGGSGKTFISLALSRAWTRRNINIQPYKKGPDYIDSTWLTLACKSPCFCLDPFFLKDIALKNHFIQSFQNNISTGNLKFSDTSIALIEGNRGLFDGKDVQGSCSSAHLAKLLDCPVIVSINCAKMTRTVAALVMGLQLFDKGLNLAGIILNNIGSQRHAKLVQECVEYYTSIPVLGVLPRMNENPIPERHMGLYLHQKNSQKDTLDNLADFLEEHINVGTIAEIAYKQNNLYFDGEEKHKDNHKYIENLDINYLDSNLYSYENTFNDVHTTALNIAYFYDDALWFYYQENLQELKTRGANLIPLSILDETPLHKQIQNNTKNRENDIHALYIGGGFPELYASDISQSPHLKTLRNWIENNMPVYAECGGFMILSKALHIPSHPLKTDNKKFIEFDKHTLQRNKIFPMAHIFEAETEFFKKPQGLGYIVAKTLHNNPFHPLESTWYGHEFHFSKSIKSLAIRFDDYILGLQKGHGMEKTSFNVHSSVNGLEKSNFQGMDGLLYKQCFASYAHLFAPAVPHWGKNFILAAKAYKQGKKHIAY